MLFDEMLDADTIGRIEREHDADVSQEAYEVHAADLASMRLGDHLHRLVSGSRATVHLLTGDVVLGSTCGAPPDWLVLRQRDQRLLVAVAAIARLHVEAGQGRPDPDPPPHSLGAVLREHREVSGRLRIWSRDGTRVQVRLQGVCADFIVVDDGVLVPVSALAVVELR